MQLFYDLIKIALQRFVLLSAGSACSVGAIPAEAGVRAGSTALNWEFITSCLPLIAGQVTFHVLPGHDLSTPCLGFQCALELRTTLGRGGWLPQDLRRPKLRPAIALGM